MNDTVNITLSGPTGSGKSLIGGIIAKALHERGADVELLLDGCPAPDSGIDLSGFAVVMREASAPTSGAFEVTGPPVSEMPAEIRSRLIAMGIEPRRVRGVHVHPSSGLLKVRHRPLYMREAVLSEETAEEYATWQARNHKAKPEAKPMPQVGPLDDDSARHLNPHDIVRYRGGTRTYQVHQVAIQALPWITLQGGPTGYHDPGKFDFVARPGTWMPYTGSENPAPELDVRVKEDSGIEFTAGPMMQWDNGKRASNRAIVAFMVVPEISVDSPHGRVTIGDTDHVIDMPDPKSPASLKAFWDSVAAHYRSERANDTAITLTLSGPPGAGKTRFGEYMLRALSDYGSTLGKTQDVVEQNIRRFHESEEAGRPVYVGRFEGSSLLLGTRTVEPDAAA